jgi:menaquinone-dependent protoporphyrinogen oxidase
MSVLIAIATAHNTTNTIGHRIAGRLRTHVVGPVDVLNIADIPPDTLPQYNAVIIGSAIHAGNWLSPARKFIHKEQQFLAGRPVWAYSVGVPGNEKYKEDERIKIEKGGEEERTGAQGTCLV